MRNCRMLAFIALTAFAVVSICALMPCQADAKMTEAQAVKKMQELVAKFSDKADQLNQATTKCYGGGLKKGETLADLRKRCSKFEGDLDAERKEFAADINKLLGEVDDEKAKKAILNEINDLNKCDKTYDACKGKCTEPECISNCGERDDKCRDVQEKDIKKILEKMGGK